MSIFDIFKPAPAAATQQAVTIPGAGQPGNIPPLNPGTQSSQGTAPNGTVPAGDYNSQAEQSPLAEFQDLWKDDPTKKQDPATPITSASPEDINKSMQKLDFSNVITPQNLTAIGQGGEAAQKAFVETLNSFGRTLMTQATVVNNTITQRAVSDAVTSYAAKLPQTLRDQTSAVHLADSNPLFNNPAVKPIMEATRSQLLEKFPNATPAQITEMTNNYITAVSQAFAPKVTSPQELNQTNWDLFLNGQ